MAFNGTGTFLIDSSGQPVVNGTVASATVFNALTADLATGLSTCITKDGQTATTVRIPFANGINSTLVTDTTSAATGSIITAGGIGAAKALFLGTSVVYFGGTTSSQVSLRRSSTTLLVRLGDDSAYAGLNSGAILCSSNITATDALISTGRALILGASDNSSIRLKSSSTTCAVRLGDDSADGDLTANNQILSGSAGLRFSGTAANDVRINKNGNFTLRVQKGDGSALGSLECGTLTPTVLNYTFGGFSGSGAYNNFTFSDGLCTSAS